MKTVILKKVAKSVLLLIGLGIAIVCACSSAEWRGYIVLALVIAVGHYIGKRYYPKEFINNQMQCEDIEEPPAPQEKKKFNYKKIFAVVGLFVLLWSCRTYIGTWIDKMLCRAFDNIVFGEQEDTPSKSTKSPLVKDEKELKNFFKIIFLANLVNEPVADIMTDEGCTQLFAAKWTIDTYGDLSKSDDIAKDIRLLEDLRTVGVSEKVNKNIFKAVTFIPVSVILSDIYSGKYGEKHKDHGKYKAVCQDILNAKNELAEKAAATNKPVVIRNFAQLFINEKMFGKRDLKRAIALLEKAAALGDNEATYELACIYFGIHGREGIDILKSFFWTKKAAVVVPATGKQLLAMFYLNGIIVPKNNDKAIELLKEAAALGNTKAAENLKSLK